MGSLAAQGKLLVIGSIQKLDDTLVLRAIHLSHVDDLDIHLWEQAARELSRALHHGSVDEIR
ncbi:hypothetical protein CBS101457_001754 [Exobasidium rhododendri]|nr:hypothetical protein CBS101457_001754 [Exobasidium rhododendri]